jgi:uncharacterized protein (TIGR03437 family)
MRRCIVLLFSLSVAFAQERLIVFNAASQTGNGTAAPGSMVAIELVPDFDDLFPTLDPTALNVTILPNGLNFAMECEILPASGNFAQFLNPLAVVAVLPSTLPLGPAQLSLYHSGLTVTTPISIVPSSLGLFSPGPGFVVQQVGSNGVQGPNQLTHPAQPGDTVTLWATGLGSATQVTVLLGGVPVTSSSAGPAQGMPGVDQIQFVVPDDPTIPNDCYVAAQAQAAGVTSNTIPISKTSDGSACQSTLGLTAADLATLDGGGTVGLAQLTISASVGAPLQYQFSTASAATAQLTISASVGAPVSRLGDFLLGSLSAPAAAPGFVRTESANFTPLGENAAGIAQISGTVVADSAFFGCTAAPPGPLALAGNFAVFGNAYNFGSKVTLQGAGGSIALNTLLGGFPFLGDQISPPVSNPSQLAPPLFMPGTETFSGSGGVVSQGPPAAAPFSVQLTLPPEIMATNFSALQTINRQQDLMITWNSAGFGEQDVLTVMVNNAPYPVAPLFIAVNSFEPPELAASPSNDGLPVAICKTPAASGQTTIPAAMLQALKPSQAGGPPTASINLSAAPRSGATQTFSLPLADGSALHAVLRFASSENWPVTVE